MVDATDFSDVQKDVQNWVADSDTSEKARSFLAGLEESISGQVADLRQSIDAGALSDVQKQIQKWVADLDAVSTAQTSLAGLEQSTAERFAELLRVVDELELSTKLLSGFENVREIALALGSKGKERLAEL